MHFSEKSSYCSPTLTSFHLPLNKLSPHSYNIIPPQKKFPQTFTPFYPLRSSTLKSFYTLWTNWPLNLTPFYPSPPWQPSSYPFSPPLNKYPLTFIPILSPLASQIYIILTPLNKLPPTQTTLPTLAAQILPNFATSEQTTPSLLHRFTHLGSSTLH